MSVVPRVAWKALGALVAVPGLLAGCATGVALTREDRAAIRTVSVRESVTGPERFFYMGTRSRWAIGVLGPAGVAAAPAAERGPAAEIHSAMRSHKIDVRTIVREKFVEAVRNSRAFADIRTEGADAEFQLHLRQIGFGPAISWSLSQLRPLLAVEARLVTPEGRVVWERRQEVLAVGSDTPSHSHREYVEDPERIREAFTAAAEIVVGKLVRGLD